ncbi:hypothetical protein [Luteibacter sp.]|jgi:hypothetical protein|uniref:hypothetical protein n=1 Tax=Luteibacter sp. TaxID=1886636 RepID=UPI002F3EEAA0
MIRELPILFSAPMVRAILEGRKTVTRRVVNPQPDFVVDGIAARTTPDDMRLGRLGKVIRCPCGKPGDRLYVRETSFRMPHPSDVGLTPNDLPRTWQAACDVAGQVLYRADMESRTASLIMSDGERWTPSIHMPKDRARIWLEVTGVRVERLQDISEEQARAEGSLSHFVELSTIPGFTAIWDSLAKPGTRWADNPWVWCVEFRRVAVR